MAVFRSFCSLLVLSFLLVGISGLGYGRRKVKSIADISDEDTYEEGPVYRDVYTTSTSTSSPFTLNTGAILKKNRVKGPADIGIYYVNSPSASCGGFSTGVCSKNCGALGYPVYWCYPKVCYCHYGTKDGEDGPELPN